MDEIRSVSRAGSSTAPIQADQSMSSEKSSIFFPDGDDASSGSTSKPRQEKVYHFLIMAAATIIIIAGLKAARGLFAPILLALFVTIILLVPLRWLRKKGCPNVLALILVLGGTIVAFSGITYLVGKSMNDFILRLPAYKDRIVQKLESLDQRLEQYGFQLGEFAKEKIIRQEPTQDEIDKENPDAGIQDADVQTEKKPMKEESPDKPVRDPDKPKKDSPTVPSPKNKGHSKENAEVPLADDERPNDEFPTPEVAGDETQAGEEGNGEIDPDEELEAEPENEITPVSSEEIERILTKREKDFSSLIALDSETVLSWVILSLLELRHVAEGGFLVLIFTVFMIFEASRFPEKIDRAFGKEGPIGNEHFHRIADDIRRYLFLKAISSLMSAVAATFVYWMFGVPATLFWGVIAFFLYFIPNIGGTMAAIIPGMLIFMTHDIQGVLLYAVCLIAIECAIAYGIEPRMLGHGLGISVVVILLSLFSWGWILGPIGLFLAAPLTIMVKIILQAFKETEWIAILLDDNRNRNAPT